MHTAFEALTKILVTPAVSALFTARVPVHPCQHPAQTATPCSVHGRQHQGDARYHRNATADEFSPDNSAIFEEPIVDRIVAASENVVSSP